MRCLALAKQFGAEHDIWFLSRNVSIALASLVARANISLLPVNDGANQTEENGVDAATEQCIAQEKREASVCLHALDNQGIRFIDILVVDHYGLSTTFCSKMRIKTKTILVIDDLANRHQDCNLLLNQNCFDDIDTRYQGLVPSHCTRLLGPKFAILRDEFYENSDVKRLQNHLVVCFGGSDPLNLTERIVDILISLKTKGITADIVVGSGYGQAEQLQKKLSKFHNMTLHINCPNIAELMRSGSLMIGAGGSMHWERAHSGIPGLIITLAENQKETTQWLHQRNCCLWIGDATEIDDRHIAQRIENALNSPELMQNIANNAMKLVGKTTRSASVAEAVLQSARGNYEASDNW